MGSCPPLHAEALTDCLDYKEQINSLSPAAFNTDTVSTKPEFSLTQIMKAFCDCKTALMMQIKGVRIILSLLKQDLQNHHEHTTQAKNRVALDLYS